MNSQGTNEFGASRGFHEIWMPSLLYDSTNRCLSGGHRPSGSVTGMCSSASWPDAPAPSGPTPPAPTPPPPPAATRTPTRTPTSPTPPATPATCADDDACLAARPGWSSAYTCGSSTRYCSSYSQDMHLCCPVACDQCPSGPPPPAATPPPQPAATRTPTRAPTGAPTSPASTRTPTRSPTAPPVSSPSSGCVDGDPRVQLNGSPATCAQLQNYCDHSSLGAQITSACPLTCGANGCTAPCNDLTSTGVTINGAEASCSQLASYCTSHASMVVPKCRRTCGDC